MAAGGIPLDPPIPGRPPAPWWWIAGIRRTSGWGVEGGRHRCDPRRRRVLGRSALPGGNPDLHMMFARTPGNSRTCSTRPRDTGALDGVARNGRTQRRRVPIRQRWPRLDLRLARHHAPVLAPDVCRSPGAVRPHGRQRAHGHFRAIAMRQAPARDAVPIDRRWRVLAFAVRPRPLAVKGEFPRPRRRSGKTAAESSWGTGQGRNSGG